MYPTRLITRVAIVVVFSSIAGQSEAQSDRFNWRSGGRQLDSSWSGNPSYRFKQNGYDYRPPSYYVQPPVIVPAYPYGGFYPGYYGPAFPAPLTPGYIGPFPGYQYQYNYNYWYQY